MRFYLARDNYHKNNTRLFKLKPYMVKGTWLPAVGETCEMGADLLLGYFPLDPGDVAAVTIVVDKCADDMGSQRRRVIPFHKKEYALKYYEAGMKVGDICKSLRIDNSILHEALTEAGYVCKGPGRRWVKPQTLMDIFAEEERKKKAENDKKTD